MFTNKVAVLIIYGCFLIALSLFKTTEIMLPTIYQMEGLLGGDKLTHLTLSSILSLLALWALMPAAVKGVSSVSNVSSARLIFLGWLLRCFGICLLLVSGLLVDEIHQSFVGSRRFEWLDFAYGVGGIGIGCAVYLIVRLVSNLPKLTHKY